MRNAHHDTQRDRATERDRGIFVTTVVSNEQLCDEHYRLRMSCAAFPEARAGQFLQILCHAPEVDDASAQKSSNAGGVAMLRRAFSIADLDRRAGRVTIDIIHRVVGAGTHWLSRLRSGDAVSVLGPLGGGIFTISETKSHAYLVSGGVGLPPMFWLAKELAAASKQIVSFFGAQTERFIPLALPAGAGRPDDTNRAIEGVPPFADSNVPVVLSTDDGSVGVCGLITDALARYDQAHPVEPDDLVVYTCGPEPMMRAVAAWCARREIDCQVCMERNMACGMGTCQSCVVPCRDPDRPDGRRYRLCCSDGPVFDRRDLMWD